MPPTQLPLTLAQRHNNQQLFSDHYLNVTLPQRPEWRLLAHDAGAALAVIAPIVRDFLRAPAQNEAQTEDDLIKPVLRALGHTFEIQAALKTPDGTKKPDYIFYRDQAMLTQFAIEMPGRKLEEVRKRRPKSAGKLTPAAFRALRVGYAEQAGPIQQRQAEVLRLEQRLADLVNQAYGSTSEEIDLLWRTAPARMPVGGSNSILTSITQ